MKRDPLQNTDTLERIEAGMAALAMVIETHPAGERVWQLFDILERAREAKIARPDRLAAAKNRVLQHTRRRKTASLQAPVSS